MCLRVFAEICAILIFLEIDSKIFLICDSFFPFELSDNNSNAELWLNLISSIAFVKAFSGVLNSWDMLANMMCRHLFVAFTFSRRLMLDTLTNTCKKELFVRLPLDFNCLYSEELWVGLSWVTIIIDFAVCDFYWNLTQISLNQIIFVKNLINLVPISLSQKRRAYCYENKWNRWY